MGRFMKRSARTRHSNMLQEVCLFYLVLLPSYLKTVQAAFIPLRTGPAATSTYKPSTLQLPPGFESPQAPPEPMLYPYAVSSTTSATAAYQPQISIFSSTTPDWIPVALNANGDLPLKRMLPSTTPTPPAAVLEDRISNDEPKYSSPVYKEGPVFESIVYGTWKPDPPLQPFQVANAASQKQQQQQQPVRGSKSNANSTAIGNGKVSNKTINRQHGGFIGNIQHKLLKTDRQISLTTSFFENKSMDLTAPKLQRKLRKQGRRKIRPIISTTEENSIQNGQEVATTNTYPEPHQSVIEINASDGKLMEVAKQINESLEIKYNHKQTSTHSIDMMMTTAEANNDEGDDEADDYTSNIQWVTKATEFLSTEPQFDYVYEDDSNTEKTTRYINATRRTWPIDFIEEPLTTTANNNVSNSEWPPVTAPLNESRFTTDSSEISLALSALNIPPSLWPKLPGNITKLGKPYEAESSAEEPALCVPITVREHNIMNTNELIYIERIFCFPMPLSTTTSEKSVRALKHPSTSSTTLRSTTTTMTKVQNFEDFIDTNPTASNANYFKTNFILVASYLVIYLQFIV